MSGAGALADSYGGVAGDYPPNAHPGQCFARVLTPEVYETITEKVIDTPEKTELKVIPAVWGVDYKTILVKEGYTEYYVVPATFKTVTETIVVKPGYTHIEVVPATYETITEKVLVKEAYTVWKPGKGLAGTPGYTGGAGGYGGGSGGGYAPPPGPHGYGAPVVVDGRPYYGPTKVAPTGELLCLVEVPAEYKTVTKVVLKTPARTVEVAVPPVTKVITRTVVDVPAHVEKKDVPPVYDKIQVAVLVTPEHVESLVIPPTYKVIEKKKLVGGGKLEWREVICDDKLTGPLPANAINCSEAGGSCKPTYTPPPVYTPPVHQSYGAKGGYETTTTYTTPAPKPTYAPPPKPYKGTTVTHSYDGERGAYAPATTAAGAAAQAQTAAQQPAAGNMIARMQQALAARGYYAGPIDGLYTQPTSEALLRFQKDNKMASGQLTLETARALGIWN
jgi:hypothetical protein